MRCIMCTTTAAIALLFPADELSDQLSPGNFNAMPFTMSFLTNWDVKQEHCNEEVLLQSEHTILSASNKALEKHLTTRSYRSRPLLSTFNRPFSSFNCFPVLTLFRLQRRG